jgi:putative ABC transport system permease protein
MANINVKESVFISLDSLRANKLRTFLTLLGIIIGVMTVIGVVSIISGLNRYVETKLFNFGSNDFFVSKAPSIITSLKDWQEMRKRKNIRYEDYKYVLEHCNSCMYVGATVNSSGKIKYGDNYLEQVQITGQTENDNFILGELKIVNGRLFTRSDVLAKKQFVIIGWDVKEHLFKGRDPIGKWIWIRNFKFRIIGVAEKRGKVLGRSQDNFVKIPITTFFKKFGKMKRSISITVHTESLKDMENAQEEIRQILRARRHIKPKDDDDFAIETQQTFLDFYKKTTATMYLVMIIISSISLLVGSIVIMNIMLVSVAERVKEIGLRKAVGARRKDILFQFLIESITLSIVGGSVGIIIGFAIAKLVSVATGFPSAVELWSVIIGIVIATFVGLISGIYPANKAAKLDPVEALRS